MSAFCDSVDRRGFLRFGSVGGLALGQMLQLQSAHASTPVKKKDVNALWDAGEVLDQACENCHRSYWYPGEDAQFYRGLRRRLDEAREKRSPVDNTATPQKKMGVPQ